MYPLAKSLLFGGVTRRFPDLPFVLQECGVSWGMQLLVDAIEHWEKRNLDALEMLNPARLDRDELGAYFAQYPGRLADLVDDDLYELVSRFPIAGNVPDQPDEFAAMGVAGKADIVRLFADSFYFGCEADDRGMVTAFLPSNPGGARLRAVLGSDIGHWDVTDIAGVVAEAHELVEKGFLTDEQWRQIVFDNPVEMLTRVNPDFFVGTAVADRVSITQPASP